MMCDGFYGNNFGQPVCSTCHLFLFSADINKEEGEEVYTKVSKIALTWLPDKAK